MKRMIMSVTWGVLAVSLLEMGGVSSVRAQSAHVVENFEKYATGSTPSQWIRVDSRDDVRPAEEALEPGEKFEVLKENGNKFVRLYTNGEYIRFSQRNGKEFEWNLETHPRLQWRWRALTLPKGASERGKNDTAGAVYVTFGKDWLGRPKSIKYTYSSSLPVGTVVSFGPLKVIVVDSGAEPRQGTWQVVQRNVVNDYRQVFGSNPPDRPVSITISGDSDTTGSTSKVDIDDIKLLPPR
ncbi:MAG: DUF3047 domain-containing protein [Salinibacter sp.]